MQTDLEDCSWEEVYSLYGISSDFRVESSASSRGEEGKGPIPLTNFGD